HRRLRGWREQSRPAVRRLTPELADTRADRERLVGVSLKMYFGFQETLDWCARIGTIASGHPAVASGVVRVFVLPTFPLLLPVIALLRETPVAVGGQNLYWQDSGPFTGEVSGRGRSAPRSGRRTSTSLRFALLCKGSLEMRVRGLLTA